MHYIGLVYHADGVSRRFPGSHMGAYSAVKRYQNSDVFYCFGSVLQHTGFKMQTFSFKGVWSVFISILEPQCT